MFYLYNSIKWIQSYHEILLYSDKIFGPYNVWIATYDKKYWSTNSTS